VLSGTNSLFAQGNVLVEGNAGHTSIEFASPLSAADLRIEIDHSNLPGGQQDNIGIDNIRFGQNPPALVPLPAAWVLFVSGLVALSFPRWRRG
jgi:hypothetical protein